MAVDWNLWALLCLLFVPLRFSRFGGITWWFVLGILLSLFGSILTILFDRPAQLRPPFRSLTQLHALLSSKRCSFVLTDYHSEYYLYIKSLIRKELGVTADQQLAYQTRTVASRIDMGSVIGNSRKCLIGVTMLSLRQMQEQTACYQHFTELQEIPAKPLVFAFRSDAELAPVFRKLFHTGDIEDYYAKHMQTFLNQMVPRAHCKKKSGLRALNMSQLIDIFLFAFAGYIFASVWALLETFVPAKFAATFIRILLSEGSRVHFSH